MPEWATFFGAFIRWCLKGFKTSFKDEIKGNLEASWGGTYDFENLIIGIIFAGVIITVFVIFFF